MKGEKLEKVKRLLSEAEDLVRDEHQKALDGYNTVRKVILSDALDHIMEAFSKVSSPYL